MSQHSQETMWKLKLLPDIPNQLQHLENKFETSIQQATTVKIIPATPYVLAKERNFVFVP